MAAGVGVSQAWTTRPSWLVWSRGRVVEWFGDRSAAPPPAAAPKGEGDEVVFHPLRKSMQSAILVEEIFKVLVLLSLSISSHRACPLKGSVPSGLRHSPSVLRTAFGPTPGTSRGRWHRTRCHRPNKGKARRPRASPSPVGQARLTNAYASLRLRPPAAWQGPKERAAHARAKPRTRTVALRINDLVFGRGGGGWGLRRNLRVQKNMV